MSKAYTIEDLENWDISGAPYRTILELFLSRIYHLPMFMRCLITHKNLYLKLIGIGTYNRYI